jgi:hypothetical protein
MNAKVHDTIGVSPAELIYGKAINLYTGLLSSFPPESLVKGQEEAVNGRLSDHISKLIAMQTLLIEAAWDKQLGMDSFHMIGSSRTGEEFPVNSYVLYKPPDGSRTKLQMPLAGPFIVVGAVGDKYSIQDLLTHKVIDTHVSNLIAFRYDPNEATTPLQVSARNAGEFFVDKISNHNGSTSRRTEMEFLVSWKGYSSEADSCWEPFKGVCKTQAFVDYCLSNRLVSLIPKSLRGQQSKSLSNDIQSSIRG